MIRALLTTLIFSTFFALQAQIDRYPANVTPIVAEPASVYLSDYIEVGSERLSGNILFNDFNEASWTFKLRLTIQSSELKLTTKSSFNPSAPITVMPGELYRLVGADWAEYFDFANLEMSGDVSSLRNRGKLPEGYYSFCMQVIDYDSGDPLSDEICQNIYIKLLDPPLVISPACNSIINPITQVQIPITWQIFNTSMPNGSIPEYQITIWELLESTSDPLNAVTNGQALQVYQSDIIANTNLNYGPSEPLLDMGKTYIYRIQAIDRDGKSYYKNEGYSQYCYFHYGYPTGGKINIIFPEYGAGFRRGEVQKVHWSRPSNWVPNYALNYEVIVKEIEEEEDAEAGMVANDIWNNYKKTGILVGMDQASLIDKLAIEQRYAWQVKAFANDVEVASSDVSTFSGPSLVEEFFAGNYRVMVDYISNKELTDLSGGGRVRLSSSNTDWYDVQFEHLHIRENAGLYFLESGTIHTSIPTRTYDLEANFEDNGDGVFVYDEFRMTTDGMEVKGYFEWDVPFAVEQESPTYLRSQTEWLGFNRYEVYGSVNLEELSYELFDPSGFRLDLSETSVVYINQDMFRFSLNGTMVVPDMVKPVSGQEAGWAFVDAEQLGIINTLNTQPILAFEKAGIEIHPQVGVIDLSENESPGKKAMDPMWKGIYMMESTVKFPNGFDYDNQLTLDEPFETSITHDQTPTTESWIGVQGLDFKTDLDLTGVTAYFNTFPANYTNINLDINHSNVNDASKIEGTLLIPFVDETNPFDFGVQIYNQGFRPGTISNLTGTDFVHNPEGGDLALNLSILKAEIVDKKSIRMTLDMEWTSIDVSFKSVPNLMLWGDYSVGFFTPEGVVALAEQIQTTFRTYPVTIDALSAGRNKDQYGIAISGKVVMGEDVSGDEGAPAFNLYSFVQNAALDASYEPAAVSGAIDLGATQSSIAQMEEEIMAYEEDLNATLEAEKEALMSATLAAIESAASSLEGEVHEVDELFELEDEEGPEVSYGSVKENVLAYLDLLQVALPFIIADESKYQEKYDQVDQLKTAISGMDEDISELQEAIDKLRSFNEEFAANYVASLAGGFLDQVDNVTNDIIGEVTSSVNNVTDEVDALVEGLVNTIIDNAADQVINSMSDRAPNIASVLNEIKISTKNAIIMEVTGSIDNAVNENIIFPASSFISENLSGRAHRLVKETAKTVVTGALSGSIDAQDIMKGVIAGFEDELSGLGSELLAQFNLEKLKDTIEKLGSDAVNGIDTESVVNRISQGALEAIAEAAVGAAVDKLADITNNALGDEIGIEIPLDFAAAGAAALLSGNPKELLFDPIPVKVRSPLLEINGLIHFMRDHPIYGDGFAGEVQALIKKPNEFLIDLAYINGRKEDVSFWMVEIGGAAQSASSNGEGSGADMSKVGGEMSETNKEPPEGLKLGPLEVMAFRGRFYHKMSDDGSGKLVPDAELNYGANLHLIMFGPQKGTKMRLELEAAVSTYATGDYTWSFEGNAQFVNSKPSIEKIDEYAVVKAVLRLSYNSAEKHFVGYASAEVLKPGALCASGSLLVDVKPGAWRVAIGSQEEKISFVLGCAGFGPSGWLDLNQNTASLGLGLEFLFYTSISLDVKLAKVALIIDAGANAGVMALIQYKPDFKLLEAGVWLELWATIVLAYKIKFPKKKGSATLAEIYVAAEALMKFNNPTVLTGEAKGKIKVLFFNFKFDESFEMELS